MNTKQHEQGKIHISDNGFRGTEERSQTTQNPIQQIRGLSIADASTKEIPCVYFLLCAGRIVYIGQTENFSRRIRGHADKKFDSIRLIECWNYDLRIEYERRFIHRWTPEYNLNPGGAGRPKGEKTVRITVKEKHLEAIKKITGEP